MMSLKLRVSALALFLAVLFGGSAGVRADPPDCWDFIVRVSAPPFWGLECPGFSGCFDFQVCAEDEWHCTVMSCVPEEEGVFGVINCE